MSRRNIEQMPRIHESKIHFLTSQLVWTINVIIIIIGYGDEW